MSKKTERGDPSGFFNIHSVRKDQKSEGGFFGEFFFEKKSHRAEYTLSEYTLAPLSFLDDIKILLRKLSKNCENCKIVRIVRKMDHSEWDCRLKKLPAAIVGLFSLREKAPTKNVRWISKSLALQTQKKNIGVSKPQIIVFQ